MSTTGALAARRVEQAAQRYSVLLSPELHHLLITEMGWTAGQHRRWVTGLLEAGLLGGRPEA
ncbi:MAG TPA: hypothetical protein VEC76_17360 [Streptosporangiaceae bacterium]|nr:hypothetical protein [Streptosporangiaceae bacterium]